MVEMADTHNRARRGGSIAGCPEHLTLSCLALWKVSVCFGRTCSAKGHGSCENVAQQLTPVALFLECWVPNIFSAVSTMVQPELMAEGPVS